MADAFLELEQGGYFLLETGGKFILNYGEPSDAARSSVTVLEEDNPPTVL